MKRIAAALSFAMTGAAAGAEPAAPLPLQLRDTGLYAPGSMTEVRAGNLPFSPQYALWSDGAAKRRWLYLPPGASIDASRPDAWDFPPGTRAWKEFRYGERRVETRFIERLADGSWRFAAYVWNREGTEALLAPGEGTSVPVPAAPGGRYAIPSRTDCLACHEGAPVPVLGFSALQLSPALKGLDASGRLRNLAPSLLASPPRIAAPSETARAALGYLHANCGHCHNHAGPLAATELSLAQQAGAPGESAARTLRSLERFASDLARRVRSTNPYVRMPPLGVALIDAEGVALLERWILSSPQPEISP